MKTVISALTITFYHLLRELYISGLLNTFLTAKLKTARSKMLLQSCYFLAYIWKKKALNYILKFNGTELKNGTDFKKT